MRPGHFLVLRIAGDAGQNADAQFVEQRFHLPQLARQVVFADDIDVVRRGVFRLHGADHIFQQRFTGQLVTQVLVAHEAGGIDGNHRLAELLAGGFAHCLDIVTDQRGDAGLIHEHRRRIIFLDHLTDGFVQALLAAVDHIQLVDIGGESGAIQARSRGLRAAVVPRVAFAGDRAVHQMRHIGDGLQRDLGAIEGTATGGGAGYQLLGAALLAFFFRLALILAASRFVEHFLYFAG